MEVDAEECDDEQAHTDGCPECDELDSLLALLQFQLRLVLAQLQVFVVTVQTVVLQLDGGMLQFDIAIAEFKALVLQREAQCLFLQASLFEFVADMSSLHGGWYGCRSVLSVVLLLVGKPGAG